MSEPERPDDASGTTQDSSTQVSSTPDSSSAELTGAAARARGRRMLAIVLGVALTVIAIDHITKAMAIAWLLPRIESGEGPVPVIGTFLQFTYVENTGAAFGIGTGYTWVFTIIAVIVVIFILRTANRIGSVWWAVALGALLGGAAGNLIDRLTREPGIGRGYVVDFIALPNFPVFNCADMAVTGAAALMVVLSLLGVEYSTGRRR